MCHVCDVDYVYVMDYVVCTMWTMFMWLSYVLCRVYDLDYVYVAFLCLCDAAQVISSFSEFWSLQLVYHSFYVPASYCSKNPK